jgi:acyl-CoA synthetase (AMP-forming)/AMP-acid ligase II
MEWHFAEALEAIADAIPDEVALVHGEVERSWGEYDQRAAALASALHAGGLRPNAKIGLLGYNSSEYLEAHFAVFKMRGVPINVNYRYTEDELVYLLQDADAEALVFDAAFAPTVAAIRGRLPLLKLLIEIDDGSGEHLDGAVRFEAAIAASPPFPRAAYSPDDIYMLYTGGTTGMPKGVMYRHGDFSQALLMAYAFHGQSLPTSLAEIAAAARRNCAAGTAPIGLAACPLMHGTGIWAGVFMPQLMGGRAVTYRAPHFDAEALWQVAALSGVSFMSIVGDSFARPMLDALRAGQAGGRSQDLSRLKIIFSSGVMFSREIKEGLLNFADVTLLDSMGATEGIMAASVVSRASPPMETANFKKSPTTRVFDANDREVVPGSDTIGMIANGGAAPIGYYKDPVKSAATFRVIDGHRYSFPGDFAKVAADGSLILLGRGSACINTGGEKVFPEEVEEALKAHPDVEDALVVGLPDERFGQCVAAVVSPRGGSVLDAADLTAFARQRIASYKAPRHIVIVDQVRRAANGKADYPWAKSVMAAAAS